MDRNSKNPDTTKKILNPIVVSFREGTKNVRVKRKTGEALCQAEMKRTGKAKGRNTEKTEILG